MTDYFFNSDPPRYNVLIKKNKHFSTVPHPVLYLVYKDDDIEDERNARMNLQLNKYMNTQRRKRYGDIPPSPPTYRPVVSVLPDNRMLDANIKSGMQIQKFKDILGISVAKRPKALRNVQRPNLFT